MPYFVSRSLRTIYSGGASALLLLAVSSASPVLAQEKTFTETLQGFAGSYETLDIPNFDARSETLLDVTFTLMLGNKDVTIFDAQNPSHDLLNVSLMTSGHSFARATSLANWEVPSGKLTVMYRENVRNSSSDGAGAQLLFGTHGNFSGRDVEVNFLCLDSGGSNGVGGQPLGGGGGGGNPLSSGGDPLSGPAAVPEPGVNYLSFLAAGAMALLLFGRKRLQRISAWRD